MHMNNNVHLAPLQLHDVEPFLELADEMDAFYGQTSFDRAMRSERLREALFSDPPRAYSIVAWNEGDVVGVSSYSFLWPAEDMTTSLYLKELYVATSHRNQGVGRLLVSKTCEIAREQQCTRVELATELSNRVAQGVYARLGMPVIQIEAVRYRLGKEDIARIAEL